jgi:hypothetical protein
VPLLEQKAIHQDKVVRYLLRADHRDNGGKAQFFGAHGFEITDHIVMVEALLLHATENEIESQEEAEHGLRVVIRCSLRTPDGRNPCIRSVWMRDPGSATFRLITAYPSKRQ